ncbi:CaiB/BaiF CoA transferase family protein [Hydrogenophaga sp. BPS33]|uniref:CaiB/BaiF CoA transferase family protein n=1 Tax=Hydrogenophaga sp. BPS33 TaxID=2651974 RepID=UPI00131F9A1B|nr:CoA transferase [Hydrogenophaga sp. BPS33]QHE83892.1 CoA transferase [Hydrogenophaga sp. BPS33]
MLSDALQGFRVLDFSQGIAGPHGACLLGEMGAEVIKIEPPTGDWLRVLGARKGQSSVLFATFNRGKRGVMLDLKKPDALETARGMIAQADVMLESYRVGVMARLGLDHETVRKINPRLVYVSVTGFGQQGPYIDRPATDAAVQAYSGFSFGASDMVTPMRVRLSLVDIISGIYTSQAIVAALLKRARTGEGQTIDISLAHSITAVQGYKYAEHELTQGAISGELFAGIGLYATADGFIAMSAMKEQHIIDLMGVLGLGDALQDPRFATPQARFDNQGALRERLSERFARQPSAHWLPLLRQADLIHQEVLTYDAYRRDPQVLHQRLFTPTDLNEMGTLPTVRMPGLSAETAPMAPPPSIGQHTQAVLLSMGLIPPPASSTPTGDKP